MFTDGRSKRVVFLAHCFLNQNAISDGTAVFPTAVWDVIRTFLDAEAGIVQLSGIVLPGAGPGRSMGHSAQWRWKTRESGRPWADRLPNCGVAAASGHDQEISGRGKMQRPLKAL